jgi:16S rRNA (cytosine967-C5)-methyltransferase
MEARRAAWQILRAVGAGQLFDSARDRAVSGLGERDRRLAHAIAAGVLRRRRALDRELHQTLGAQWRTTEPELKDLLRIGTYQLRHLSRVPPYAAVQSTVAAAHMLGRSRVGFVNAVLRRLADGRTDGRADGWTDGPPDHPTTRPLQGAAGLARRYSHPAWLVRRWLDRYDARTVEALLRHDNRQPPLVIQPAAWSADQLAAALDRAGHHTVTVGEHAPGFALRGVRPTELPGFAEGGFVVQGPAQARLLAHATVPAGLLVWDCCAAPGGKATMLARRGPVLASDRSRGRVGRLRDTVRRAAPDVVTFAADARHPPLGACSVDAAWLDAPCSATGLIARHPDARWRLSPRRIATLRHLQRALLDGVAPVVRAGGLMIYSTCSLEPEENVQQVDAFLARRPEYRRDRADLAVLPTDSGSDGGYVAVLRRT